MIRLSFCIATYKRAATIGETLESILPQLTDETEVIVLDGGSPDQTAQVVSRFAELDNRVRYIRENTNSGVDADFDKAVNAARGEYVWLFTDDDLLVDGAVEVVLSEISDGAPDLIVVDAEVRDIKMTRTYEARRLQFEGRRDYEAEDGDALMSDAGNALSFIGGTIIKRDVWIARDRQRFYGSLFIHVGVIFQAPLHHARVLGRSLVRIRIGNAMWSTRAFEIWEFMWPELIWSFPGFSDQAKSKVVARHPWRKMLDLLNYRALGSFQLGHLARLRDAGASPLIQLYARSLLAIPGPFAHLLMSARIGVGRMRRGSHAFTLAAASPFSNPFSRAIARLNGHSL